jgi:hypothetical protein
MSNTSTSSTAAGIKKFVLQPQAVTTAAIQDHGAQLLETQTVYDLSLRFRYFVHDRNRDMINIVSWHKSTIATLLKVDPLMKIIPNGTNLTPYNDVHSFPTDKKTFEQQFSESSELIGNKAQRITVCHAVKASTTLWNMKWRSDILMPYLLQNHITVLVDKFDQATVSSIGYLINVNPHFIHRESYQEAIYKVIEKHIDFQDPAFKRFSEPTDEEDITDDYETLTIPSFELGLAPIKFGNGSFQMSTEALDIVGTKEKSAYLKEIFSTIDFAKHLKGCVFIPRGLIQMTSVETLKLYITLQNNYLNSVDCAPIMGLSMETANHPIVCQTQQGDVTTTLIGAIEMFPGVEAVYQTNMTRTNGKWLVVFRKDNETQVKKFLDDELQRLFDCVPETCPNRTIGEYEYPRRPGLLRKNGHTLSYAQILQQRVLDNPLSSSYQSRPKRAPAAIVYHAPDVVSPQLKKTNLGVPVSGRTSTTSTVTTESLQMNEISELIDSKITARVNDVIHQTAIKIKAAVYPLVSKIDRFDYNMNANFKQLSDQMSAMFGHLQFQPPPGNILGQGNAYQPHFSNAASSMPGSHGSTNFTSHE